MLIASLCLILTTNFIFKIMSLMNYSVTGIKSGECMIVWTLTDCVGVQKHTQNVPSLSGKPQTHAIKRIWFFMNSVSTLDAVVTSAISCKSLFLCLFSEANAQHGTRADRYTLKHQRTSLVEPSLLHDHHVRRHVLRRQAVSLSRSAECFDPASVKPLHTGRLRENQFKTN